MSTALSQTANIATIVYAVSSMLSIGLAYRIGLLVGPLLEVRAVFRPLVANFVLVPLLAVGIERVIPIEPPLATAKRTSIALGVELPAVPGDAVRQRNFS